VLKKFAVKRLTASDLTFFVWHFKNRPAGNQKAINLNADVFVDLLYPSLPETEQAKLGRFPIDLHIYGPGVEAEFNIQRKIVKTPSYKNWRLNGEFVDDPDRPERFRPLTEGDFVVFEFTGELFPNAAKALFIARSVEEDSALHSELARLLANNRMVALERDNLGDLITRANVPGDHPINELTLDDALEDVVLGGSQGVTKLLTRRSGHKLTTEQLILARQKADEIGQRGEAYVNKYLLDLQRQGLIKSFAWASAENAIAPFDFRVVYETSESSIDAKSTTGPFERWIHISLSELLEMAQAPQRYDVYRVFNIRDSEAELRIAIDNREFAARILRSFEDLPPGVSVDAVSVDPSLLPFSTAIRIALEEEEEEESESSTSN